MIVIGVLLIIVAAAVGAVLVVGTMPLTDDASRTDIEVLGGNVGLSPLALLIAGAVLITVLWLGLILLRAGARRSSRRRKDAKATAQEEQARRVEAEQEMKDQLAMRERELAEERRLREEETAALRREASGPVAGAHGAAFATGEFASPTGEHTLENENTLESDRDDVARRPEGG